MCFWLKKTICKMVQLWLGLFAFVSNSECNVEEHGFFAGAVGTFAYGTMYMWCP